MMKPGPTESRGQESTKGTFPRLSVEAREAVVVIILQITTGKKRERESRREGGIE